MREVGIIGLGLLGSAMGQRLRDEGYTVHGYDIRAEQCAAFTASGGQAASSAIAVVERCEQVLLSLPDSSAVAELLDPLLPHASGKHVIDTTTGDPEVMAELGARLAAAGVTYYDATVVGSSQLARSGQVTLLVGGSAESLGQVQSLLDSLGSRWFHVGPCGSGARAKLVVNLVLGLNRAVLAEALALARHMKLDLDMMLDILRSGAAYARVMDAKGRKMIDRDYAAEARLQQHHKDVRLILAQGRRYAAALPLSTLHDQLLDEAERQGYGQADNSAIAEVFLLRDADSPAT